MPDVDEHALALYQTLRAGGSEAAARAGGTGDSAAWRRLTELGLVETSGGRPEPVEPSTALIRAMEKYRAGTLRLVREAAALEETALALVTVYQPAAVRRIEALEVEYVTTLGAKLRAMTTFVAANRRSCDEMHLWLTPVEETLARGRMLDTEMVSRGVHIRTLYPRHLLGVPRAVRYFDELVAIGVEIRLIDDVPCDLVIGDGLTACLPGDPAAPRSSPLLLLRSQSVVGTLAAFYDDCWRRATPYPEPRRPAAAELSPQERVAIRLLAMGLSDDQIARKTGVHRRTVQRTVAKLMDRLGATSRFEAGLRLAQDPELSRVLPRPRMRSGPFTRT
ncbi:helix-turn-helix transcriptional regulator [Actinacidiphila yeochonensis]|uniref:helix-turn-helix transcriptional regulator n=1 Tax=Actinacidiphila yeochonensis TaxID=89050 RepID=UPI00068AF85E|nr:helix-turn-helix transcriptional regulator [Actinacidiphila yeochonensis]